MIIFENIVSILVGFFRIVRGFVLRNFKFFFEKTTLIQKPRSCAPQKYSDFRSKPTSYFVHFLPKPITTPLISPIKPKHNPNFTLIFVFFFHFILIYIPKTLKSKYFSQNPNLISLIYN
jgi:hypothetical protein